MKKWTGGGSLFFGNISNGSIKCNTATNGLLLRLWTKQRGGVGPFTAAGRDFAAILIYYWSSRTTSRVEPRGVAKKMLLG